MKKILCFLLPVFFFLASCKKSNDAKASGSTFTATVNGQVTTFNINAATLIRDETYHEKRMDIAGTSQDSTKRIIITLGLETSLGSGMTVKSYVLNPFPEDDPNTADVDESLTTQGFTTYSSSTGSGNWLTDVYDEQGMFVVNACDSAHSLISGTFKTTLVNNFVSPAVTITITDGKMENLKYTVLN